MTTVRAPSILSLMTKQTQREGRIKPVRSLTLSDEIWRLLGRLAAGWGTNRSSAASRLIAEATGGTVTAEPMRRSLSQEEVNGIRDRLKAGATQLAVALEYEIDQSWVSRIASGEAYAEPTPKAKAKKRRAA